MKLSKLPIEIGNFVCLYGEKELLDHFEDRVWEVFRNNYKISWNKGEDNAYIFHGFELKQIEGDYYLCGKIVRQMTLKSSQKYDEEKQVLKPRLTKMDDSPSTFFLLRLFDHKLIILKETTRAPGIEKLEKVIMKGLLEHRGKVKKKELAKFKRNRKKKRLTKELRLEFNEKFEKSYPKPHFRITPIASYDLVKKAFLRAKMLKSLNVTLFHTNQEDPKFRTSFLKQLSQSKKNIGHGKTTTVKGSISDAEFGLNVSAVKEVAEDVVTSQGNASFTAIGEDGDGARVTIKDNEVSIKDSIPSSEVSVIQIKELKAAKKLEKHADKKSFGDDDTITKYKEKALNVFKKIVGL